MSKDHEDRSPQGRGPQKPTLDAAARQLLHYINVMPDADTLLTAEVLAAETALRAALSQSDAQAERIATLEAEVAEAQQAATFGTPLVVDAYKADRDAALAHAAMLRDALREFTPGGVPHNGVACALREFAAERQRASGKWDGRSETLVQWAIAIEAALASTPAADLAAHDAEVWEKAWKCGHEAAFTKHDAEVLERGCAAIREVRIQHMPALEDDDQGPFLHESDVANLTRAIVERALATQAQEVKP